MKILISGSSGFIGYHLSKFLINKGYNVLGLDNHNNYYSKKIKNKRLLFLKKKRKFSYFNVDLTNFKHLENIFLKNLPDIVFHLAGQPGVLYSFKNPKSYKLNNVVATKNICKLSLKYKVKKFFFASSSSVYGDQKKFPIKETYITRPKNPYAISKLESEKIVKKTFNKSKTNYLIFRFFSVYGPLGRPDMFIHKFLNYVKLNKTIKLFNNGLNYRDFTFIDDVIGTLYTALRKKIKKQTINICRSKPIQTIDIVRILKKTLNKKKIKINNTKFVKGEMLKTHGCNKKMRKISNFKFTNLEIGLKKTVKMYKKYKF